LSPTAIVALALTATVAAFLQAVTGFGFAVLFVPAASVVVGANAAVVGANIAGLGAAFLGWIREREHVRIRQVSWLAGSSLAGLPIGALLLQLPPRYFDAMTVLVSASVGAAVLGRRRRLGPVQTAFAGLVSGVLTTSTGMNGPPVVVAVNRPGRTPQACRATLSATLTISGSIGLGLLLVTGPDASSLGVWAIVLVAPVAVGTFVGHAVGRRLPRAAFHVALRATVVAGLTAAIVAVLR